MKKIISTIMVMFLSVMLGVPCMAKETKEPVTIVVIKDEDGNYTSSLEFDSGMDYNFAFRVALAQQGFESRMEFVEPRVQTCCENMKKTVTTYELHSPDPNSDMCTVHQIRLVFCMNCNTILEKTEIGSYTHSHPSV